ncbi:restriction endonuclease subunit S [Brumimicrobium aurantiacum]|uniref:Type I restriction endonuclease subunit S n=1 Tax=Brumimicrobium aurantiacum TaxID=1737063 RepID=A0A3E1EZL2_9FLAO|nr:restriction endonuclease subunit S [Brumimicrobium aurantiacum]RFC55009.1 type I restriction endonuclease subunit S [Brumimicrobium aurantiacum]
MEAVLENILSIDKSDWKPVKFGDVVFEPKESSKDLSADGIKHVVGLEHISSEDIHLRNSKGIEEPTTFTKRFSVNDVLFGRRRAYLKKAAQASFEGVCSGDITVFRAKDKLIPELLPFIVNNEKFFDYAIKHSAGGLSPRVKFKDLVNYEFLLPPKDQQAKLAELLWAMDEVVEREREVLTKLTIDKTVSLKDFFKKDTKEFQLKQIGKIITGSTPSTKNTDYWNGNIQFVTPSDLETQIVVDKTERYITEEGLKVTREIPPNSVMIVCIASVGKMGISSETCATNQQINSIIPNKDINPKYLYNTLSLFIHRIISRAANSVVPILNKSDFSLIKIPLLDRIEREEFVKIAEKFDKSITDFKSRITSSQSLQKSLINQIF